MTLTDLLEEFNAVIDTAEGLTELRSLILGLAVRGKLVPQDPNDEPASELLKKIEAEKKRLYEEERIRKPKKLPPVSEEEVPFEIPESWEWSRVETIGLTQTGTTPKTSQSEYYGDFIPFVGPGDISEDKIDYSNNGLSEKGLEVGRFMPEGTILMVCIGGSIGKCHLVDRDVSCNQQINTITPVAGLNGEYIKSLFKSDYFQKTILSKSTGSATPIINRTKFGYIPFSLPPLEEQHRIVQKIESLFAEVDELESKLNRQSNLDEKLQLAVNAEVQKAPNAEASQSTWNFITSNFETLYHTPGAIDNLKKNILNEAVRGSLVAQNPNDEPASKLLKKIKAEKQRLYEEGEIRKPKDLPPIKEDEIPFEIPESWEWVRLGSAILYTDAGKSPSCEKRNVDENEWGVLTTTSIQENQFLENENKVLPEKFVIKKEYQLQKDDVLITRAGPLNRTGISCHVDKLNHKLILSDKTVRLKHSLKYSYPRFTPIALNSGSLRSILEAFMTGMAESQVNISQTNLQKVLFPLPPLEEQHRIVRRFEELFAICDRFKVQLEQQQAVNEKLVKGLVQEVLEKV